MTNEPSVLTSVEHAVGTITLNRPQTMNAITVELGAQLHTALQELGSRDDVNVIVIRGAGGNLCAGGDFDEVQRLQPGGPDALRELFENFSAACAAIAQIDVPVVVIVEGVAMAGGFELMLAADIAIASDDARIADNHIRFGQIPGGGSSQRLPRAVGRQRALGMLLGGDRLTGRQAAEEGLVYRSLPPAELPQYVEEFVATLAGRRRDAAVGIKRLVYDGLDLPLHEGIAVETDRVVAHIGGSAGISGISQFNERGRGQ